MFLAFLIIEKYRCISAIPALSHGAPSYWPDTGRHMSDLWDRIPDRRSKRNGRCSPASPLHQAVLPPYWLNGAGGNRGSGCYRIAWILVLMSRMAAFLASVFKASLVEVSVAPQKDFFLLLYFLFPSISLVPARLNIKYLCFIIFHN